MASHLVLLRILAFLVDSLLMTLSLVLPATLISWGVVAARGSGGGIEIIWLLAAILSLLGILLRDGWRGRSPGKRLLGLRLATANGKRCGYGRSLVRNLPLLIPLLNVVELYLMLFAKDSRRTGDRLAGTNVVEE